jgi:putative endonuclease
MSKTKAIGDWGESCAVEYLLKKSYGILDRNYRIGSGELDIVASLSDLVVFVEVKTLTRIQGSYDAEEQVTSSKRRRCERAARHWLSHHEHNGPCRFDVISIEGGTLSPRLHHFEDAWIEGE